MERPSRNLTSGPDNGMQAALRAAADAERYGDREHMKHAKEKWLSCTFSGSRVNTGTRETHHSSPNSIVPA